MRRSHCRIQLAGFIAYGNAQKHGHVATFRVMRLSRRGAALGTASKFARDDGLSVAIQITDWLKGQRC